MSYEAVPCKIRAPSQDGTNGTKEIIGIIIRPSNPQDGSRVAVVSTPPGVIPIKGSKPFIIGPGSSRSLIISNDQIPKVVMRGAGSRGGVSPNPSSKQIPFTSPTSMTRPQLKGKAPQRVDSPSYRVQSSMEGTSPTPHSGIQSLPTTPPISSLSCKLEEKADEESKFDDMPTLLPVDQMTPSNGDSASMGTLDEWTTNQGSECESSLPSSILNTSWNPQEIATQLLSMASFDPLKIEEVTSLMLQRSKEDEKKKEKCKRKIEKSKGVEIKRMKMESGQRTKSESKNEKKNGIQSEEEELKRSESEPPDEESNILVYRMAMRRRLIAMVEETTEGVIDRLHRLSIGNRRKRKNEGYINPIFSPIQWEVINAKPKHNHWEIMRKNTKERRKEKEEERKKNEVIKERKGEEERRNDSRIWMNKRTIEGNGSDPSHPVTNYKDGVNGSIPSLPSPLHCECIRGRCLTQSCINRSSRFFCTPSTCSLSSCSNRLSLPSSLCLSRGILKTNRPTKSHQFLGEIVGEVISTSTLISRLPSSSSSSSPLRAFSLSPTHFVDCTRKGWIARFVKHSCQPNSTLEIWWEDGVAHCCLFSLVPLSLHSEITIDFSFISPLPFKCSCSFHDSPRSIPPSTLISLHKSINSLSSSPPFLKRNLKVNRKRHATPLSILSHFYLIIDQTFRRRDGVINRKFAHLLYRLRSACEGEETELFTSLIRNMEEETQRPDQMQSLSTIRKRVQREMEKKKGEGKERKKWSKMEKNSSRCTSTTYLDSLEPVGMYSPDVWSGEGKSNEDAVRCVCGVVEDDGEMIECDECHYWLHSDCVDTPSIESYACPLCINRSSTPQGNVKLKDQPTIRLEGCLYFKALESEKRMQIRLNECVYVRRPKNENHKKIIRALDPRKNKCKESPKEDANDAEEVEEEDQIPPRSLLRVFRVERLFESPSGHRFVFGFYYARPHETFCDENRLFHPNEVFATPLYDTLPIQCVVGKCIVMDQSLYCQGRPRFPTYKDQDVLFCEYQLDRHQKHFDKCKKTYYLNTEPYAFQKFEKARSLQRCFTPFTYSSSTTSAIATCSQEDTYHFLRQQSTKRINNIVKRLTHHV